MVSCWRSCSRCISWAWRKRQPNVWMYVSVCLLRACMFMKCLFVCILYIQFFELKEMNVLSFSWICYFGHKKRSSFDAFDAIWRVYKNQMREKMKWRKEKKTNEWLRKTLNNFFFLWSNLGFSYIIIIIKKQTKILLNITILFYVFEIFLFKCFVE